ncbi:MocR-like pyridoxine biosynthesis transcription factor PdxR [Microlunatus soli]|uniref:GntR family transcriptional regulator / MocR family aminotransferase n=1 Tax=Microlunatus soli TaxID=630515 RepID=A0A1H1WS69_9ACTN|nr:PLP-dependent aminotransferase family protein [Microlunatus soli]SDS99510.1 GntR family transcriptional regulator / MocR family aminotransferase [Microlunatus soli]
MSEVVAVAGLTLELGDPSAPLSRRLMNALRSGIRDGRLPAGSALPPSRLLAGELGCSRWAVTEAYGQLVAEGYLSANQGSATRVRDLGAVQTGARSRPIPVEQRPRFDLAPGVPDLAAFPRSRWAESYRRAVLERPTGRLTGSAMIGSLDARTVITDYLRRTRQVLENPTQLNLSTGATAATGWVARLLFATGHRRIAVEDPSWHGLRDAARRVGLELVPIEVDQDGLRVEQLDDHDVRAVIVTPAHQFPTGVALSASRRLALIDWARRVDGTIIEDDYDAEFRYDRRPVASLQGMAPDRVVLVGSVSKTLTSSVGLGWVVLPQQLIMQILAEDLERGAGPSGFVVDAMGTMIKNGWYERHLRSTRTTYRRRRAALLAAIEELLPQCRVTGMPAGLHLVLRLPDGTDVDRVVGAAATHGVGVIGLDRYRLRPVDEPALVLGFGNLRSGRERDAVALLSRAIEQAAGSVSGSAEG